MGTKTPGATCAGTGGMAAIFWGAGGRSRSMAGQRKTGGFVGRGRDAVVGEAAMMARADKTAEEGNGHDDDDDER